MMDDLLQRVLFMLTMPVGAAYICRLASLNFKVHKPAIVLLHLGMALSVAWAGWHALSLNADLGHAAAVLGAACWIRISYPSWKRQVPTHFESRPASLEPIEFTHISGGRK